MKKLFFLIVSLLAVLPLAKGQSSKVVFDNDPEQYVDSVVRIFVSNPDDPSKGIQYDEVELGDGVKAYEVHGAMGTGFVINKEGYIVTNNHVAAIDRSSRTANSVIWVVETVSVPGAKRYIAHKAKALWLSPENDLAVIQCNNMHAQPIPLDEGDVKGEQDVYTMGFPGLSDQISLNPTQRKLYYSLAKRNVLNNLIDDDLKKHPEWKGQIPDDEQQRIDQQAENDANGIADESTFMSCLAAIADEINPTWNTQDTWDIGDVVKRSPSWANYFEATQNDGKVQKVVIGSSWSQDAQTPVPMIQHSIGIQHGNSGGPLLSDRGGVIGVVGDGMGGVSDGDSESADFATQTVQIVNWLDSDPSRHYEKLVYVPRRTVIVGGLALLVVAIGLVFLSFNTQRTPAPAGTGRGSKAEAAAYGVTVPSKQAGGNGGQTIPAGAKGADRTMPAGKSGSGWVLSGRAAGGKNLRVEFNDGLFSRNGGRLIIGRNADLSHLVLDTNDVSRQHAQIRKEGSTFFIADRNSSNKTAVNGQFTGTPFQEVTLREGDTLTFGEVKVEFNRL